MRWTVIIPAKALPGAKSRLLGATAGPDDHRVLVEAIRADTIVAAGTAAGVERVLIVTDRAGEDGALVQSRPGLNGALRDAEDHAHVHWPADGVAALVGDLPALRPDELADVLREAAIHARAYVPDAAGTGTTLLTAAPGQSLDPGFGPGSATRHGRTAIRLDAGPGLRHDVDTVADLDAAARTGLGRHTAAVWGDSPSEAISRCSR